MARISLPNEHGGYLTVVGAAVAAALVSPSSVHALAAGALIACAFLARGPLDRAGAGKDPRPLDRPLLGVLGVLGVTALVVVAGRAWLPAALVAFAAFAIMAGSSAVRRLRRVHEGTTELVAMTALGATAALNALAGGAGVATAAAVGLVLAGHVAASVPPVRSEILAHERAHAARAETKAVLWVLVSALGAGLLAHPAVSVCLLPRLAQVALRRLRGGRVRRPAVIGAEESVALLCVIVLVAQTLPLAGVVAAQAPH